MSSGPAFDDLGDRIATAFPYAWVAWLCAARDRCLQAGSGSGRNELPLELGHRAQDLESEDALRSRRVDRIAERAERRSPGSQGVDHLEEMPHGSCQAIEARDDQDVPCLGGGNCPCELEPVPIGAGPMLCKDCGAASVTQRVELGIGRLFIGRYAGIADQARHRTPHTR